MRATDAWMFVRLPQWTVFILPLYRSNPSISLLGIEFRWRKSKKLYRRFAIEVIRAAIRDAVRWHCVETYSPETSRLPDQRNLAGNRLSAFQPRWGRCCPAFVAHVQQVSRKLFIDRWLALKQTHAINIFYVRTYTYSSCHLSDSSVQS